MILSVDDVHVLGLGFLVSTSFASKRKDTRNPGIEVRDVVCPFAGDISFSIPTTHRNQKNLFRGWWWVNSIPWNLLAVEDEVQQPGEDSMGRRVHH